MTMHPLRVGLLGAGRIGQMHAATLAYRVPGAALVAVADVNATAAHACAEQFHIESASDNPLDVVNRDDVEAVLICTSTDTHVQLIEAAAQAGKHIFCEKPIALNLADVDRALNAVTQAGVALQIGFNRRFDANFQRVRRAVETGEIGTPHTLHLISRDPAPPPMAYVRVSGGLFVDMAVHDFDMARFLIGSEVDEVYVQAGVNIDPAIGEAGDVDTAVTMLRFANGVIGTIDNSRKAVYGYDQRVEIFGSGGAIHTLNNYPNNVVVSTAQAVQRDLPQHFFMQRYAGSYAAEIEQFVAAVQKDQAPPVTGLDGRRAFVIGLAAKLSWQARRPVRVSEVG